MIWIVGVALVVSNILWAVFFFRARSLNRKMGLNEEAVKEWLKVHEALQSSGGCLLAIKRVDPASVYYREPVR